jgi:hypothetical protein
MTLYPIAKWKIHPKFKYVKKPYVPPTGIIDKHLITDDGKNCEGWVAYRFPSKIVVKYYFTFACKGKIVKLYRDKQAPVSKIWRRHEVQNIFVERDVYKLLNREEFISLKEIEKIFAKFNMDDTPEGDS